jgi:hypothetical protein
VREDYRLIHRALLCVEKLLAEAGFTGSSHDCHDGLQALEGRTLMSADPLAGVADMAFQPRLAQPIEVVSGRGQGLFSHGARAGVGLTLPVMTSGTGSATSITVKWSGVDPTAVSITVQRSTDAAAWTSFAVSKAAVGYTDTTVAPGVTYFYRVMVKGPSSAIASKTVQVKAAIATPTATATVVANKATLTWSDTNPSTVGYRVFRSSDGAVFTLAKELAAGSAKTYSESVAAGKTTYFRVLAVAGGKTSASPRRRPRPSAPRRSPGGMATSSS